MHARFEKGIVDSLASAPFLGVVVLFVMLASYQFSSSSLHMFLLLLLIICCYLCLLLVHLGLPSALLGANLRNQQQSEP